MSNRANETDVSTGRRSVIVAGLTAPIWLPDLAASAAQKKPASSISPDPRRDTVTMTIVYDNNPDPNRSELISQWGFGCYIDGLQKTILFDTGGQGWALCANMRQLNCDPTRIDAVVLSHIHWDHTGGLPSLAAQRTGIPVYIPVGFPKAFKKHARSLGLTIIEADEPEAVCTGAVTTGTLGKGAIEEHGLCVKTGEGWVVITGCAHPGAHQMASRAHKITGGPIDTFFGGFHMMHKPTSMINGVIRRFKELGVRKGAPCHCSGDETRRLFKEAYGDQGQYVGLGSVFERMRAEM